MFRMDLGLFDTSLYSRNLGDEIIALSVKAVLEELFPEYGLVKIPTHERFSPKDFPGLDQCKVFFVGGTNLLNGNIPFYRQWKLPVGQISRLKGKIHLLGVGWWQYQTVNFISKAYWRAVLQGGVHSVRDEYTRSQLASFSVPSINTGCPTTWALPENIAFRQDRPAKVIFTLTDYRKAPADDLRLFNYLRESYQQVVFWPQGKKDIRYLRALGINCEVLPRTVDALRDEFESGECDYVGTRLHAGIMALQNGVFTRIVAVDNRSIEMAKDIGLPVLNRTDSSAWLKQLSDREDLHLDLPRASIAEWKLKIRERVLAAHA